MPTTRITVGSGGVVVIAGLIFALYGVQEWKMPSWFAQSLLVIMVVAVCIFVLMLVFGVCEYIIQWLRDRSRRRNESARRQEQKQQREIAARQRAEARATDQQMTRELQAVVHGNVIELSYDPDPSSDFIHLLVKNNGPTDWFVADVEDIQGAESPQRTLWGMKWRLTREAKMEIASGHGAHLDLCEAFPPTPSPVRGSTKRGRFQFYSATLAEKGWTVYPGPREVVVPNGTDAEKEAALSSHDAYADVIELKVHISGTSSPVSHSTTKRVRLGFNRPHKETRQGDTLVIANVEEPVFVEIDDWPTEDEPSQPASDDTTSSPTPSSRSTLNEHTDEDAEGTPEPAPGEQ